jgi:hypothetical protein
VSAAALLRRNNTCTRRHGDVANSGYVRCIAPGMLPRSFS